MISLEKLKILTPLQKLLTTVGKIIVATESGHTDFNWDIRLPKWYLLLL